MTNILTNIIPDPDTGLYSSRVAGINENEIYIDNFGWAYQTVLFYLADTNSPISNPNKQQSDYENKLSYWNNVFFIPNTTFNPGVDTSGWVLHVDMGWVFLAPQIFEQQQYAPFWLWCENLSLGISNWCFFDRSYIGEHWSFEQQYINASALTTGELIYGNKQLSGTVTVSSGSKNVIGVNTSFDFDVNPGDTVVIAGEEIVVDTRISDTSLTLISPHLAGASGVPIYEKVFIVEPGKLEGFGVYLWVHEKQQYRAFIKNSENRIFMSNVAINTTPPTSGGIDYIRVR